MEFIGTTEASYLLEISDSRLKQLLLLKRVKGAYKESNVWKIPLYNKMPRIEKKKTNRGPKGTWRQRPRRANKQIHVNQHVIYKNHKYGRNEPPISVKCCDRNDYGHEIDILGPCRLIYRPKHQLECGARLWIEVEPGVSVAIHNFMTFDSNERNDTLSDPPDGTNYN